MSFDTSHQNTGLSEGQGRPLATPKSVTKHKAPIGGCRSTPPIFRPIKTQKKRAFQLSFLSKISPVSGSHFGILGACLRLPIYLSKNSVLLLATSYSTFISSRAKGGFAPCRSAPILGSRWQPPVLFAL